MERPFYKSLDRKLEIFGLRGAWLKTFLLIVFGCLFVALLLGSIFGTGIGLAVFIICLAVAFFGCLSLQVKTPGRQLEKQKLAAKSEGWVIRRETLSRILLKEPLYDVVKQRLREMKRG